MTKKEFIEHFFSHVDDDYQVILQDSSGSELVPDRAIVDHKNKVVRVAE